MIWLGNIEEWTIEANRAGSRVVRGGAYNESGSTAPSSGRGFFVPDYFATTTRFSLCNLYKLINH